ncbi:putative signal transducing protein [Paraglaciecola arctica]|uniref:putative signal transducing protein n=1 Tax=Paraglaciecola arctica TaxID=1128911 RepID=UPI001C06C201|nr:DUF2007 domain-containing protein [Paraglaciecola arctica]MBU3005892.1 DUF2007 domain-containing protein [Paraglaciecola arctica]
MKQIYTNENRLLAMNSKNLLESAGIAVELKNEHTSGSAIPGHQIWLELWVNDDDYNRAMELLSLSNKEESTSWVCGKCGEDNPESFNVCWNCQAEKP